MTDEEKLDEARAIEAMRRYGFAVESLNPEYYMYVVTAARLAREGWKPVDRHLLIARKAMAENYPHQRDNYIKGSGDDTTTVKIILIALRIADEEKQND